MLNATNILVNLHPSFKIFFSKIFLDFGEVNRAKYHDDQKSIKGISFLIAGFPVYGHSVCFQVGWFSEVPRLTCQYPRAIQQEVMIPEEGP